MCVFPLQTMLNLAYMLFPRMLQGDTAFDFSSIIECQMDKPA